MQMAAAPGRERGTVCMRAGICQGLPQLLTLLSVFACLCAHVLLFGQVLFIVGKSATQSKHGCRIFLQETNMDFETVNEGARTLEVGILKLPCLKDS